MEAVHELMEGKETAERHAEEASAQAVMMGQENTSLRHALAEKEREPNTRAVFAAHARCLTGGEGYSMKMADEKRKAEEEEEKERKRREREEAKVVRDRQQAEHKRGVEERRRERERRKKLKAVEDARRQVGKRGRGRPRGRGRGGKATQVRRPDPDCPDLPALDSESEEDLPPPSQLGCRSYSDAFEGDGEVGEGVAGPSSKRLRSRVI